MISKKFDTVIDDFGKHRGFTPEETENFRIYAGELFQKTQDAMRSKQYDFIVFVFLGTFFLKVWTVHKRMTYFKNQITTGLDKNKDEFKYRKLCVEHTKMEGVYKRMTDNFLSNKLRLLEQRENRQEKKIGKRQMMEMIMDEGELNAQDETITDDTERDTETGLGEQGTDS